MILENEIFARAELLLGEDVMSRIHAARVIIFGVGGVGSWCAESLVRTGIRHLTIVDCDRVCVSNINRQLMATTETVGQMKVDALRRRLLEINPYADITACSDVFTADTAPKFDFDDYDYVVDAIDSLKDKILLIDLATRSSAKFFSSMGAALKLDPTKIKVAEFRQVTGCPLARALRQRFKKNQTWPRRKFKCVYSDELIPNAGPQELGDAVSAHDSLLPPKAQTNGSLMHITAIFGLTLAGLIVGDITRKA